MQPLFCPSEFVADVYDTFGYHDIHQCIDEDENIVTDMYVWSVCFFMATSLYIFQFIVLMYYWVNAAFICMNKMHGVEEKLSASRTSTG